MTETIIAVGISGIILLAASQGMVQMSGAPSKLLSKSTTDATYQTLTQGMATHFQSAYVATQYQHLPIAVSCPNTGLPYQYPCVRQLDDSGTFSAGTPPGLDLISSLSTIEFFRDHDPGQNSGSTTGLYKPVPAWGSSDPATVQVSTPLSLSADTRTGKYFATWPLLDDTSAPLVMLRASSTSAYFKFDKNFSNSNHPGDYGYFKATKRLSTPDTASVMGSLFLVYNAYATNQYSVQYVKDIHECWDPAQTDYTAHSFCDDVLYNIPTDTTNYPTQDFINSKHYEWMNNAQRNADVEYVIDLESLPAGTAQPSVRFAQQYQPTFTSFGSPFAVNWGQAAQLQDNAVYSFPSSVSSLVDTKDPSNFPSNGTNWSFDVRRLQHYYDSKITATGSASAMIVGVPITMTAYYLNYNKPASDTATAAARYVNPQAPDVKIYSLVSSIYNQGDDAPAKQKNTRTKDPEVVLLDRVTSKIIFGRQLGTTAMSLFVYQSNSKTVSSINLDDLLPGYLPGTGSSSSSFAAFDPDFSPLYGILGGKSYE